MRSHNPFQTASDRRWRPPPLPDVPRAVPGPLRLAAYVDRYPPNVNAGAETMLHALLTDSVAHGHRVDVVAGSAPGPFELDGVHVWPRAEVPRLRLADVLIGHLMWTREAVEIAAERRLPLIYIVHNDRQLTHWKLRPDNVTMTVWNSAWVAARLAPRWDAPQVTIRPPVLTEQWTIDGDPAEREFVTLVNPNPEKGGELLYRLARRTSHRYLAVQGAYGHQLRPTDATPNVTWQPHTSRMRDDVYARTRVLLVPSKYESWGRVAAEAMAAGIPVIAHPTHGLEEQLGDAAIWANRDSVRRWQEALECLDDPAEYARWSARARARSEQLDQLARSDMACWERTVRLVASARRVRSPA